MATSASDTPLPSTLPYGGDMRGRILRGTATAVARIGIEACTVQDILDAAGISRRTFYKAFRNRDETLDALYEIAVAHLAGLLHMAVAGEPDPGRRLVRAIDAYLDMQVMGGRLVRVLQAESLRVDSPLAARREALMAGLVGLLSGAVAATGGRVDEPFKARALLLALEGLVHHVHREGPFTRDARQRVRGVIVPMMLHELGLEVSS